MNIISAFIIFNILIILYEIIVELFSALYQLSGLTKEQAKFQVTSLLTGTGFTTSESESMLKTRKRKKLTRIIMIVSYIFNVSIISTLVTLLASSIHLSSFRELLIGIIILVLLLLILVLVFSIFSNKINKMKNFIHKLVLNLLGKVFYRKRNQIIVYNYYNKYALAEIKLNRVPENLKEKTIKELKLEENFKIKILSIKRKNKVITKFKDNTKFYRKDLILLIGTREDISSVFQETK